MADEKLLNLGVYNPFQTDIHRLSENIINLYLVSWQVINISRQYKLNNILISKYLQLLDKSIKRFRYVPSIFNKYPIISPSNGFEMQPIIKLLGSALAIDTNLSTVHCWLCCPRDATSMLAD